MTVIVAARGYPGTPASGGAIRAIDAAEQVEGVTVFHAGTALAEEQLVAKGGRVLAVTAVADTLRERARPRLSRGRPDRFRRRIPPPRHRLARAGAGATHERAVELFLAVLRGRPGRRRASPDCSAFALAAAKANAWRSAIGRRRWPSRWQLMWHGPLGAADRFAAQVERTLGQALDLL